MKAIIGITSQYRHLVDKTMIETNGAYIDAVVKAGGIPIMIPMVKEDIDLQPYIDIIDGIIFSGGQDILPAKFGEEPAKGIGSICVDRDNLELKLLELAMEKSIGILGICRGYNC